MNSNFQLNSFRNFNSNFFQLIPSKFVTFGEGSLNKINSGISDSQSNRCENSIIFKEIPSNPSNKFKFNLEKASTNMEKNNNLLIENSANEEKTTKEIIAKKEAPIYFNNSFQIGSKTVLNAMNTCLLDLFSPTKNNKKSNLKENNDNIPQNDYKMINILNEEFLLNAKDINYLKNNNFSMEKMKFSPIKKMTINEKENKIENINSTKNKKFTEINTQNNFKPQEPNNSNENFLVQGAFKAMNNNYENPAKNQDHPIQPHILGGPNNIIQNPNITSISNVTNITNNYYFQYDNPTNLLKKKTKRVQNINKENIIESSTKKKTKENFNIKISKKDNLSYGLYQLNQISVNGVSISKFPVVSMNEDDLEVPLLSKMLNETDYFTIVDKYYINIPVLDEEKYNKPFYDKVFKKEKEKISNLYLIGDNLNENNPINLIRNFYSQIKDKILNIQKNYLSNNKKQLSSNIELCKELERLIISCNAITNTVTDYKKCGLKRKQFLQQSDEDEKSKNNSNNYFNKTEIKESNDKKKEKNLNNTTENKNNEDNNQENNLNNKKKKQKKKHFKTYLCEFCNKAYSNGQGLGGHMSRIHPNQSYKYKDKIRIRREREKKREKLLNIKRDLFKKYGYNYDKLMNEKNKSFIQQFLLEHNEEYKNIRKNQKKENKNNENISENEEEKKQFGNTNIFKTPLPIKMNNIYKKKVEIQEIASNNLSKEKTHEKTEFKINDLENSIESERKELGFITKLKINFVK